MSDGSAYQPIDNVSKVVGSEEDLEAIKSILLTERSRGVTDPLLPLDVDIDGDGICDSFGLDENDNVVYRSGVSLDDTVYISDGDDVEGGVYHG